MFAIAKWCRARLQSAAEAPYRSERQTLLIRSGIVAAAVVVATALSAWKRHDWTVVETGAQFALLKCDAPIHDFGDFEESTVSHDFTIRNSSNLIFNIVKIGKSCSCVDVALDRSALAPRETVRLSISAHAKLAAGVKQAFAEEVVVHAVDGAGVHCATILRLRGTRVPTIHFEQPQVTIEAPRYVGSEFRHELGVWVNEHRDLRLEGVDCLGPLEFTASIKPIGESGPTGMRRITISIAGELTPGDLPRRGTLRLRANRGFDHPLEIPVVLRAAANDDVHYWPPQVAFGILRPQQHCSVLVTFRGAGIRRLSLLGVSCSDPHISVNAERSTASGAMATTELRVSLFAREVAGAIDAAISFTFTDGLRNQIYSIPCNAFVTPANASPQTSSEGAARMEVHAVSRRAVGAASVNDELQRMFEPNRCGPISLCLACRAIGVRADLEKLNAACAGGLKGTSFLTLVTAARDLGVNAEARKASLAYLRQLRDPAIIDFPKGHFSVFVAADPESVLVSDPPFGLHRFSMRQFEDAWGGHVIVLSHNDRKNPTPGIGKAL